MQKTYASWTSSPSVTIGLWRSSIASVIVCYLVSCLLLGIMTSYGSQAVVALTGSRNLLARSKQCIHLQADAEVDSCTDESSARKQASVLLTFIHSTNLYVNLLNRMFNMCVQKYVWLSTVGGSTGFRRNVLVVHRFFSFVVAYLDAWSPCSQCLFYAAKSYLAAAA